MENDNGLVMTAHGRWQVVQGLAKPVIRWVVVVVILFFTQSFVKYLSPNLSTHGLIFRIDGEDF